ncbi:hypothetical protein [Streptomyces fragilis]|uniref:Uncharacterized protein n=1 Tax=Streptomyces fragilis TaxID=67301 RepID=A0ABV2YPY5_9ACTN|nr:hypothetical protein [Streptomyces fragilis]
MTTTGVGFNAQKQTAAPVHDLVDQAAISDGTHRDQPPLLMIRLVAFAGALRDHRTGRHPGFVDQRAATDRVDALRG